MSCTGNRHLAVIVAVLLTITIMPSVRAMDELRPSRYSPQAKSPAGERPNQGLRENQVIRVNPLRARSNSAASIVSSSGVTKLATAAPSVARIHLGGIAPLRNENSIADHGILKSSSQRELAGANHAAEAGIDSPLKSIEACVGHLIQMGGHFGKALTELEGLTHYQPRGEAQPSVAESPNTRPGKVSLAESISDLRPASAEPARQLKRLPAGNLQAFVYPLRTPAITGENEIDLDAPRRAPMDLLLEAHDTLIAEYRRLAPPFNPATTRPTPPVSSTARAILASNATVVPSGETSGAGTTSRVAAELYRVIKSSLETRVQRLSFLLDLQLRVERIVNEFSHWLTTSSLER